MKKNLIVSALALALATSAFAGPVTISASNGGAATGSPKLNLNNLDLGSAGQWVDGVLYVSFTGSGQVVQGSAANLYAAPYVSGSNGVGFGAPDQANGLDTTRYLSTGIGSVTFQFNQDVDYFGLLWGSVDHYNFLSFYKGADLIQSFTGNDVWATANGYQGLEGTFYVNFDSTVAFDKVVASSTSFAFEIDNVAYSKAAAVPDQSATLGLLGLALAGLAMLRGRK